MASPQLGQNFVPGGTGVWQWAHVIAAARLAPHAEQNLAIAVTFSPQRGHLFATTVWCPQAGQKRALSGTSPWHPGQLTVPRSWIRAGSASSGRKVL